MFAEAVSIACQYTRPVVLSSRHYDGSVTSGMAAFVIINDEGWIITAAHIFNAALVIKQHQKEMAAYEAARTSRKQGKAKGKVPKRNAKWLVNNSYWWGRDGVQATSVKLSLELDIAVARLDPFDPGQIGTYPRFKDPSAGVRPGTSLCRLGFPFHQFTASYIEGKGFELPEGAIPAPWFPLEGIFTRILLAGRTKDGKHDIKFIETSSPGLRGQSGGPIFDVGGVVWAIQSRTHHLSLGFSPKVSKAGKSVEEHQFLSLGFGVHPEVIHAFLRENNIKFSAA